MGARGCITFYDQGKVDKIVKELNIKHGLKGEHALSSIGYLCDFRVNGQPCYVTYWDSCSRKEGVNSKSGNVRRRKTMDTWHDLDFAKTKEELRIFKEFEDRCNAEAVLVEDQEVWT
jgi:hypothetical protein